MIQGGSNDGPGISTHPCGQIKVFAVYWCIYLYPMILEVVKPVLNVSKVWHIINADVRKKFKLVIGSHDNIHTTVNKLNLCKVVAHIPLVWRKRSAKYS